MYVPRTPLVVAVAIPLGLSLAAFVFSWAQTAAFVVDGAVLVLALVDVLLSRRTLLSAELEAPDVFSLGQPNQVRLLVRSAARRKLSAIVSLDLFPQSESPDLPAVVTLEPRATTLVRLRVVPRSRGAHTLGRAFVRYPTPLGFFHRQVALAEPHPVRVYPDLASLRTYELLSRQDREHGLLRTVRRQGGESEFERLREYAPDDEKKAIDWRATARSRKLIVRQYQIESNQNLMLVLDAGRLMTASVQGTTLFDHALNASLLLAHVAVRRGDRVGLLGFDEVVRAFVPPASGAMAERRLIKATYALHPQLVESDYDAALRTLSSRVRKRSLTVLFTQVIDDVAAQAVLRRARGLLPTHLPLVVLLRDTDVEAMVGKQSRAPLDLYGKGAAAEELRRREGFARELRRSGVHVLDVRAENLTPSVVNRYLEIKARNQL